MTLLYNAHILNEGSEFKGFIVIEGKNIKIVGEGTPSDSIISGCDKCVDVNNAWVMPGAIDVHTHFREPGLTHKADILSESKAALAGGVTSYCEMPNTSPQTVTLSDWEAKMDIARENSAVNWSFFLGATNDNIEELRCADYSGIPGIKVFMGSSTGNMLVNKEQSLREIFSMGHLVAVHCEDEVEICKNVAAAREEWGDDVPLCKHPDIRSRKACVLSTQYAIKMAKECDTKLHICHVTTSEEVDMLKDKKGITSEACVAHLWFSDKDYDSRGALIKCNPAIKSESDREALRNGIRDGIIDIVATDHAPHLKTEKEGGALKAVSGMPSVQFSVPAMFTMAMQGCFPVTKIPEVMAHNPALRFGIMNRGFIREGYRADLTIVERKPFMVTDDCVLSKCGWSPFEGTVFGAKVTGVYLNGSLSYHNGVIIPGNAEELRFSR